jgi:hypothetical protein
MSLGNFRSARLFPSLLADPAAASEDPFLATGATSASVTYPVVSRFTREPNFAVSPDYTQMLIETSRGNTLMLQELQSFMTIQGYPTTIKAFTVSGVQFEELLVEADNKTHPVDEIEIPLKFNLYIKDAQITSTVAGVTSIAQTKLIEIANYNLNMAKATSQFRGGVNYKLVDSSLFVCGNAATAIECMLNSEKITEETDLTISNFFFGIITKEAADVIHARNKAPVKHTSYVPKWTTEELYYYVAGQTIQGVNVVTNGRTILEIIGSSTALETIAMPIDFAGWFIINGVVSIMDDSGNIEVPSVPMSELIEQGANVTQANSIINGLQSFTPFSGFGYAENKGISYVIDNVTAQYPGQSTYGRKKLVKVVMGLIQ